MTCPNCGAEDQSAAVNSRPKSYGIYRRRKCLQCGQRFSTIEFIVPFKQNYDKYASKLLEQIKGNEK